MSIGMSFNEYWYSNPCRVKAYRKAEYRRIENRNEELWLQGFYIYDAFAVVLGNAFAKSGSKKFDYLNKPIEILPKTEKQMREEAEREREKTIKALTLWAKNWETKQGG